MHRPRLYQISFWFQQIYHIKEGGLAVLGRKCLWALWIVPVIPILLILRALRPLVLIRFGEMNSYAIGHFSSVTEMNLCERDAGVQPQRSIDLFHYGDHAICNQQLHTMWRRSLHISQLFRPLHLANSLLPGWEPHEVPRRDDRDHNGVIPRSRQHLFLSAEDERMGQAGLRALGVPEGAPFVCIDGRDSVYKGRSSPNNDANNDFRNTSINNLVPAAEEMVRRGYFVIRMGAVVSEALRTTNPMIIDYATNGRTDFMDIFLCARCSFFVAASTGLIGVPRLFRRPLVYANMITLFPRNTATLHPGELLIPKKLWRREEGRFVTFRELLDIGHLQFKIARDFDRQGIEVIENSPEELLAVAVELDERVKGTWKTTGQDQALQERFWAVHEAMEPTFSFHSEESRPRIGAEFLRQNRKLLE